MTSSIIVWGVLLALIVPSLTTNGTDSVTGLPCICTTALWPTTGTAGPTTAGATTAAVTTKWTVTGSTSVSPVTGVGNTTATTPGACVCSTVWPTTASVWPTAITTGWYGSGASVSVPYQTVLGSCLCALAVQRPEV